LSRQGQGPGRRGTRSRTEILTQPGELTVAENNIENSGAAPAADAGAETEAPASPGLGSASAGGGPPGGGGPGGGGRFGGGRFGGGRGPRRPRQPDSDQNGQGSDLVEKVVFINRS